MATNSKPGPDIQSPTDSLSSKVEKEKQNLPAGSQKQEPRASNSDDGSVSVRNLRVQYVISEVKGNGDRHEKPGKHTTTTIDNSKEDASIAFVVKEIWNQNKTMNKIDIILKGQELREIMYHVLGKLFDHQQTRDWLAQEQTISKPMVNELWYWNELCSAAGSDQGSEQGRQDLQLLLDHLSEIELESVKLARSISSMTRVLGKNLWCLFRPGALVVSKPFQDEPQLFKVHHCYFRAHSEAFVVEAWAFSWTGTELIQEYYQFRTRDFIHENDEMTITDLPCYPVQYYKNSDGVYDPDALEVLKTDLMARGKLFRDLCRESLYRRQHTYNGELLTDKTGTYIFERFERRNVRGDIMIDFTAYKQYSQSSICAIGSLCPAPVVACKCQLCFDDSGNCTQWMRKFAANTSGTKSTAKYGTKSTTEDDNCLLLPARVLGYCFNTKVWAQFHVNKVQAIESPNVANLMQKLIFPEDASGVKEDLERLIKHHGSTKKSLIVDPIKGKGAGLVILLHGPPGVGKTLTAETLAKCAGKPLYVVGASDIGLDPKVAETTLGRVFELAERWGAVLLIDEADVFLDSRGSKGEADLSKNALVSVMLRVLEYFKGILIMTTNRVMTFDVAMLSRCHYAVNFKSLTLQQEQTIWKDYVSQLNDDNSFNKDEIVEWVNQITKKRTKLSGREIRNVFTTAQTLAQGEGDKKLRKQNLEHVYDRLMEFSEAMEKNKTTQQALLNASY
ncbi:MAG: hypothetical protein Q9216_006865 [Gyalolechia sp. 2 TL-2023]